MSLFKYFKISLKKCFEHTPKINDFIINKLRRISFTQKLSKKEHRKKRKNLKQNELNKVDNSRYRHFYDYIFKRNVKRNKNICQENHRGRVNNLLVEYKKFYLKLFTDVVV